MARDAFNNEILKGSQVTWAGRKGSALWLSRGEVLDVKESPDLGSASLRVQPTTGRPVTLTNLTTVAVLHV